MKTFKGTKVQDSFTTIDRFVLDVVNYAREFGGSPRNLEKFKSWLNKNIQAILKWKGVINKRDKEVEKIAEGFGVNVAELASWVKDIWEEYKSDGDFD